MLSVMATILSVANLTKAWNNRQRSSGGASHSPSDLETTTPQGSMQESPLSQKSEEHGEGYSPGRSAHFGSRQPFTERPSLCGSLFSSWTVYAPFDTESDVFYQYQRGNNAYSDADEAGIRANLYAFIEKAQRWNEPKGEAQEQKLIPFKPTKAKVENALDALRAVANIPAFPSSPCWLDRWISTLSISWLAVMDFYTFRPAGCSNRPRSSSP